MTPELVAEFVAEFQAEYERRRSETSASAGEYMKKLRHRPQDQIHVQAIEDGFYPPEMKKRLAR